MIDSYMPPACPRCEAVGTIVELGKCCAVRERDADWVMRFTREAKKRLQDKRVGRAWEARR